MEILVQTACNKLFQSPFPSKISNNSYNTNDALIWCSELFKGKENKLIFVKNSVSSSEVMQSRIMGYHNKPFA